MQASARLEAVAKASFQRKKTVSEIIPPDVTRAKTARWLDLISPITEWAGLKGDALRHQRQQLRIQQEASLEKLASRVREKMHGRNPEHRIPTKIIVPVLEAASLEDPESPLIEWWADLLVSGANSGNLRPVFTDIIKSLGNHEAAFLERMWTAAKANPDREFLDPLRYRPNFSATLQKVVDMSEQRAKLELKNLQVNFNDASSTKRLGAFVDDILKSLESYACSGSGALELRPAAGGSVNISSISKALWYDEPLRFRREDGIMIVGSVIDSSLDVCLSLNLLRSIAESTTVRLPICKGSKFHFSGYQLTSLGVEFLTAAHPSGEDRWVPDGKETATNKAD